MSVENRLACGNCLLYYDLRAFGCEIVVWALGGLGGLENGSGGSGAAALEGQG